MTAGAPAATSPPSPPPPRRRLAQLKSFLTHLAAGLVGGLIGVIALALSWSGFGTGKESAPAPEITAFEQRLAKLEGGPSFGARHASPVGVGGADRGA